MADAPAAPAPAPGGAAAPAPTSNGVKPTPSVQVKPTLPGNGATKPRMSNGQFGPKDGAAGVEPEGQDTKPTEAQKEAYRFKRQLKVHGKVEDVDLGEEDIARELQIARAERRQRDTWREEAAQAKRIRELAKADPESFLREAGHDPTELAKQRILQELERESMSQEQRDLLTERQKREGLEAQLKQIQDEKKAATQRAQLSKLKEQRIAKYGEALKASGMEATYENIYLMAETERLMRGDDDTPAIELTPEQLAAETNRRMTGFVENYFKRLDPRGIIKALGSERMQAILQATIADFEGTASVPKTRAPEVVAPPTPAKGYLTEREVDELMRQRYKK